MGVKSSVLWLYDAKIQHQYETCPRCGETIGYYFFNKTMDHEIDSFVGRKCSTCKIRVVFITLNNKPWKCAFSSQDITVKQLKLEIEKQFSYSYYLQRLQWQCLPAGKSVQIKTMTAKDDELIANVEECVLHLTLSQQAF
jgi:hypothetical protein